ncbi:hypothetical protein ABPG75_004456 [Micractinium tetrahymenae]
MLAKVGLTALVGSRAGPAAAGRLLPALSRSFAAKKEEARRRARRVWRERLRWQAVAAGGGGRSCDDSFCFPAEHEVELNGKAAIITWTAYFAAASIPCAFQPWLEIEPLV